MNGALVRKVEASKSEPAVRRILLLMQITAERKKFKDLLFPQ